jgi:hypothetical protein
VRQVATSLITLHEAREQADYDDGVPVQHTDALAAVQQAETAFQAWLTAQTDPSAVAFLQEMVCRSIIKR